MVSVQKPSQKQSHSRDRSCEVRGAHSTLASTLLLRSLLSSALSARWALLSLKGGRGRSVAAGKCGPYRRSIGHNYRYKEKLQKRDRCCVEIPQKRDRCCVESATDAA